MPKNPRSLTNTRSFVDFASKLTAKWSLGTTPTKQQAPTGTADHYQSMETILGQLVGFPTVTGNTEAIHDALDYIQTYLRQRGLHTKRFEHNGVESLIATTRRTKTPKVLLAAHLDVVAAPEHMFELRESKGKFYGRGVLDMKCAIATFMQVIDAIATERADAASWGAYDIGIMITSDEEAGGDAGVGYLVDKGYIPTVCVLPDGGDNWQVQTFAKGFLFLSVTAEGRPAHASRPWDGKSAIDMLIATIQDIQALFPTQTPKTDTVNIGKIIGGNTINQVAGRAEALVDVRVTSEARKAAILEAMQQICDVHGTQLTLVTQGATAIFDIKEPYLASFARTVSEITGLTITGSATMGTNDLRFMAARDVPCVSYYPIGGGHHGPDEWLDKQAFHQSYDILKRFVDEHASG
jgi:acetylornithine deacetylase/succinyl-diaminopimelate desuccinylase-like protein